MTADREAAMVALGWGTEWAYDALSSRQREMVDRVALALAAAREDVRAPFLALASTMSLEPSTDYRSAARMILRTARAHGGRA